MGDAANQPAPAGRWRDERVAGRLCQIYEPPAPSPHGAAVLYLHDQRGEPHHAPVCVGSLRPAGSV